MIELTEEFQERLASALTDGVPVVVASVDADGSPHLSFYGTTQVLDAGRLALWARDPEGGLVGRIRANPGVALVYRNAGARITWFFEGQASIDHDPAVRAQVYDASPEIERDQDPDRRGIVVVVTLRRVHGYAHGQRFMWERDPAPPS